MLVIFTAGKKITEGVGGGRERFGLGISVVSNKMDSVCIDKDFQ